MVTPIDTLFPMLDLPEYQLKLQVNQSLAAVVTKHIQFIEPLVCLEISHPSPEKCLTITPINPYGSLKKLEQKADLFYNGKKEISQEEIYDGIIRRIRFYDENISTLAEYKLTGELSPEVILAHDIGAEMELFQNIIDGINCRTKQLESMVENKDLIIQSYSKEIKTASDQVIDLVQKVHSTSSTFNSVQELFGTFDSVRTYGQIRNILTLGKTKRNALQSLSDLASKYLAWGVLEAKIEQGEMMLTEDAEYLESEEISDLARSFRYFQTQARYSKQRVWKIFQSRKEDYAKLGFFPQFSNDMLLDAEESLTIDDKEINYQT